MLDLPTLAPHAGLRRAYRDARTAGATRHRDIAQALALSEGELIAAHVGAPADGLTARRLLPSWPEIVAALHRAGEVMALTRNASCVHEKTGCYDNASAVGGGGHGPAAMGLVLGGAIDLRLFYRHWAHGFAVEEATAAKGVQRSWQFFDASGTAVHKVFATPRSDLAGWAALVAEFADPDAPAGLQVQPPEPRAAERPDLAVAVAAFHEAWAGLRDTHDFFALLKAHGVSRTQALRLAEPRFAQQVDSASARQLLRGAAGGAVPIMVFVGNAGTIQIHSGPVRKVEVMGPWLNVLDPGFNLHLREDRIAQAWAVRKPTSDGLVSSLELFDADGETVAMFFGERKPGRPELCGWRQLLCQLVADPAWQAQEAACAAC
jgi:putative hemin transport protein